MKQYFVKYILIIRDTIKIKKLPHTLSEMPDVHVLVLLLEI